MGGWWWGFKYKPREGGREGLRVGGVGGEGLGGEVIGSCLLDQPASHPPTNHQTFVWRSEFRVGCLTCELWRAFLPLEIFVWECSLGDCRLGSLAPGSETQLCIGTSRLRNNKVPLVPKNGSRAEKESNATAAKGEESSMAVLGT